jgi:hypothetical protein
MTVTIAGDHHTFNASGASAAYEEGNPQIPQITQTGFNLWNL